MALKQWLAVSVKVGGKRAVKISDIISMKEISEGCARYTSIDVCGVYGGETLVVYGDIETIVAEINGGER